MDKCEWPDTECGRKINELKGDVKNLFSKVNACLKTKTFLAVFMTIVLITVGLITGTYAYTYRVESRVNAEALKQAELFQDVVKKDDLTRMEDRLMVEIKAIKD